MPKIPQEELDRIKSEIDLAALVRAKGVELKSHGTADLIGRCPFHADKTPSLVVTPEKGLWHCLGACQVGGSVVDWVMKTEGVSFRHAVTILQEGKAASLLSSSKIIHQGTTRKLECPLTLDADDLALLNQVTAYYHETLKQSPKAREYLRQRGLESAEAIATFKLGYADRTLGLRLPEKTRKDGEALRQRLQALGVYRSSGHEHLSGSLIIPVLDGGGQTVNLYGRKVLDNLRPGTAYHLYLPGPHRALWNPVALKERDLILCESLIDALSFWVHGFKNVTCAYGVEGFTEDMLSAVLQSAVRRVFIAYDRDDAGDRAAQRLAGRLTGEGLECFRVLFPLGTDANDFIRKTEQPAAALAVLLNGAEWLGKGTPAASTAAAVAGGERVDLETGEVLDTAPPLSAPELPSLAASQVLPVAPQTPSVPHVFQGEDVHITLGDRAYRVRGLHKNLSYEVLKVNLRISVGDRYHLDTLDFYSAKAREGFLTHAAGEVRQESDVLRRDLGRILLLLEALQEAKIAEAMKPKTPAAPVLSAQEHGEALAYLKAPDLPRRIVEDLTASGYVGEETNKLVGYLAAVSRKSSDPLSVLIQSSSAAGKSSLMEAVLALLPPEDKAQFSALTGQALFYMEGGDLKHKVLSIAEDGGMQKAAYALKMLITEKRLSIAAPGKDPETGKLVTQTYTVEGPAAVFYTTTAAEVEPELKNRCLVLTLDEDRAQTEAILALQRFGQTLEGKRLKKRREAVRSLHHNVQRLLRPLEVVNRYAAHLTFQSEQSRLRRDQLKYLGLMNALALLHQHQRPIRHDPDAGEYVEVELEDVALAGRLCAEVLGRTLDELAPQTRRLLHLLTTQVSALAKEKALEWPQIRLSRFDIRKATRWGDTALKVHLRRLVELEYLVVHKSRGLTFEYELLYRGEGEDGGRFMLGLIDGEELRKKAEVHGYDSDRSGFSKDRSGVKEPRSGAGQGSVSPRSGGGPGPRAPLSINKDRALREKSPPIPENAHRNGNVFSSHHNHKEAASPLAAVSTP